MGWEQRGKNSYYYKKERNGSDVKSVYVGRGYVAHMVAQIQSSSSEVEKLIRAKKLIEANELDRAEAILDRAIELSELFTQATLLVAGFHTHHRQWRRKRNGPGC
jgi:predicted negative regulator of RcsB-dependent stress response